MMNNTTPVANTLREMNIEPDTDYLNIVQNQSE